MWMQTRVVNSIRHAPFASLRPSCDGRSRSRNKFCNEKLRTSLGLRGIVLETQNTKMGNAIFIFAGGDNRQLLASVDPQYFTAVQSLGGHFGFLRVSGHLYLQCGAFANYYQARVLYARFAVAFLCRKREGSYQEVIRFKQRLDLHFCARRRRGLSARLGGAMERSFDDFLEKIAW